MSVIEVSRPDDYLHGLLDSAQALRDQVIEFCSAKHCDTCPAGKLIDENAVYEPDSCPLRVHTRELVHTLIKLSSHEAVHVPKEMREAYKVDWLDKETVYIKGFDYHFKCRGMQYEVGKTFSVEGEPTLCGWGLHYCGSRLEVFDFYPAIWSRFAWVTVPADADTDDAYDACSTKECATSIKIEEEISLSTLIKSLVFEHGYRYLMGTWVSGDTLTVDESFAMIKAEARVCINNGDYSTMKTRGGVSVAIAPNSAVFTNPESMYCTAIADRENAIACTCGLHSLAAAMSQRSVAMTIDWGSVAVAGSGESMAILCAEWSVGVAITARGSRLLMEGNWSTGVTAAHTEVTGEHNVVVIPRKVTPSAMTLKAVEGTTVIFWPDPEGKPVVTLVRAGGELEPGTEYTFAEILLRFGYTDVHHCEDNKVPW